ncbi:MAG: tetratricopeptide repeat protein [Syntrophobacterales bacterium]|nr:tetratricopeptide repeat protein [Syntrophobacterales bacterium]
MSLKHFKLLVSIIISLALFISSGGDIATSKEIQFSANYYNDQGLSSFNKGFYNLLPKRKKEEAAIHFENAARSFKKALEINGDFTEARRNLARVYFIRKEYARAVEEYKKVVALDPYDMNARLAIASAYVKLGMHEEAIAQLRTARDMNDDPVIIDKLNTLMESIDGKK